jgi:hypothetical protein
MQERAHHLRARESKRSRRVRAMFRGSEWNPVQLLHLQPTCTHALTQLKASPLRTMSGVDTSKSKLHHHVLDNRHGSPDSVNAPDMKMMRRNQSFYAADHLPHSSAASSRCPSLQGQHRNPGERFELATSLFAHGGSLWLILRCTRGPLVYGSY